MKNKILIILIVIFSSCVETKTNDSNSQSLKKHEENKELLDPIFLGLKFGDSKLIVEQKLSNLLKDGKIKYEEWPKKWFNGMTYTYKFIPNKEDYYVFNGTLNEPIIGISSISVHFHNNKLYKVNLRLQPYNYFIKERINKELYNYIVSLYKDKYGRNNNYLKEDWYWSDLYWKYDNYRSREKVWSDFHHRNIWEFKYNKIIEVENYTMSKSPTHLWDESQQWIWIKYYDSKIQKQLDLEHDRNMLKQRELERKNKIQEKKKFRDSQLNDL